LLETELCKSQIEKEDRRVMRIDSHGGSNVLHGVGRLACERESARHVHIAPGIAGIERKGFLELGDGFLQ
jgi:hypothetical protein